MKKRTLVILGGLAAVSLSACTAAAAGTPPTAPARTIVSPSVTAVTEAPVPPRWGEPHPVEIVGYDGHAMEPFISGDGQTLFFNSLNSGDDTSLHYATRTTDTQFQFQGEVGGVNGEPPHLDAVASMDKDGDFYFVSTRDYPRVVENLQTGRFVDGSVADVEPVQGDFYIRKPGWIVMDAEVAPDGSTLYFVNARFSSATAVPEEARIGAALLTDSGFMVTPDSDELFAEVNVVGLVYAPSISADGLEFYFTTLEDNNTTVMVSVRATPNEPFGTHIELVRGDLAEAATTTTDGQDLYFHQRLDGTFTIFHMDRMG